MATAVQPPGQKRHADEDSRSLRVAYLVSRFPKLTETFVLYEILAMERLGLETDIYALQREKTTVMHAEAERLVERAHFAPFISLTIVAANLGLFFRRPWAYLGTLFTLLRANWGSFRYLAGALAFFPKVVYWASQMVHADVDHIHAHFASHPAAMAFAIHRLTGIPYSFTAHGSDIHCDRHMLAEKVAEAAFAVTISQYNQNVIHDECQRICHTPVHIIHCGVNTHEYSVRQTKTAFERGDAPFKIVCTGTLHEVKGQRYLIEACRRLHQKGISVECHLVGDGPDRVSLSELVDSLDAASIDSDKPFGDCVHFHGQLRQRELRQLVQTADAVATPSVPTSDGRREGIPVVLMEAMASGLPAVASRLSGIPELIEDEVSGLLVSPGDIEELAAALERLYCDESLRRRLAHEGRVKIEREFDLFRNAELLASRFQDSARASSK